MFLEVEIREAVLCLELAVDPPLDDLQFHFFFLSLFYIKNLNFFGYKYVLFKVIVYVIFEVFEKIEKRLGIRVCGLVFGV